MQGHSSVFSCCLMLLRKPLPCPHLEDSLDWIGSFKQAGGLLENVGAASVLAVYPLANYLSPLASEATSTKIKGGFLLGPFQDGLGRVECVNPWAHHTGSLQAFRSMSPPV